MPPAYALVPLLFSILQLIITGSTCTATDSVSAGRPLVRGSKVLSSNGKFALGFFQMTGPRRSSNGNATSRWYLGIWFNAVSKLTPAWVANRENPLAGGVSRELMISDDGDLAIINRANRSILWRSMANSATNNTVATLLNTGNLVLADASNATTIFWQSFDHMTDTFLPGAKLGRNKVTGATHRIVSTKNLFDLAPGIYSGGGSADLANSYEISWYGTLPLRIGHLGIGTGNFSARC